MSAIGEAFVRLRSDSTGFRSEIESQTRTAFSGVGKIVAGAFAIGGTAEFAKQIIGHASDVQKQVEAIRAEFGAASESVLEFGERGAAALGVSAHLADQTAARFGVLARNLGLTPKVAAEVTVNFERLAGSVSQIRNVDPEQLFQTLPLVLAGNTRALRQLGVATDQTQLKIAAFKLGLTTSITEALTPSQKALAIYAVATAHLGDIQGQAQSHSGDLANQMRKLNAEWDNARDKLGAGFLPAVATLATFFANRLPSAVDKVVGGFQRLRSIIDSVTGPLGGAKNALEGLIAAFAIAKIVAFANAIRTNLIANGLNALGVTVKAERDAYIAAFGEMEVATIGLAATIRAALITTGFGALLVAAGFAAEYVINHWSKVKRWFTEFAGWLRTALNVAWAAIRETAKAAAFAILENFTLALQGILLAASHLPFVGKYARRALNDIQDALDRFRPNFGNVTAAFSQAGSDAGAAYKAALRKQIVQQDKTFGGTLPALSGLLGRTVNDAVSGAVIGKPKTTLDLSPIHSAAARLNDAIGNIANAQAQKIAQTKAQLRDLGQQLADAIKQQASDVSDALDQARQSLTSISQSLSDAIGQVIDRPFQNAQNAIQRANDRQALENLRLSVVLPGGHVLPQDPQKALAELQALATAGGNVNRGALQQFVSQYRAAVLQVQQDQATTIKDTTQRRIADITDAFNRGHLTLRQFKQRILDVLSSDHVSFRRAGSLLGSAFVNGFRDNLRGLFRQAGAIAATPGRFNVQFSTVQIVRPLETLQRDQRDIGRIQHQIGQKQITLQERIAKAAEKTAADVAKLRSVTLGATAKGVKNATGGQVHDSALLAGTGR